MNYNTIKLNWLHDKMLIFAALFCLVACDNSQKTTSNDEITVIKVDESITMDIKDLVYDYQVIELENNLQAAISEIRNMYIIDDKIYCYNIKGAGNVLVFDMNGKFLNKIEHVGKARYEWVRLSSCTIDEKQRLIVLVDYDANKILEYTLDGEFVNSYKTPDLNKFEILSVDDKFYVVTTPRATGWKIEGDSEYKLNIYSKDGSLIDNSIKTKFNSSSINPDKFFEISKSFDGSLNYSPLADNTVYKIHKDNIAPYLQYEYTGNKKIYSAKELNTLASNREFISGKDDMTFYGASFLETEDLIYRRMGNFEAFDVLYNKANKKTTVVQFDAYHLGTNGVSKNVLYQKPMTYHDSRFYATFPVSLFGAPEEYIKDDMPEELVPYMEKYQNGELNNIIITYKLRNH